jgi:hypothetical protein
MVVSVFGSRAYQLSTPEGDIFEEPMNSFHLKNFYTQYIGCMCKNPEKSIKIRKNLEKSLKIKKSLEKNIKMRKS